MYKCSTCNIEIPNKHRYSKKRLSTFKFCSRKCYRQTKDPTWYQDGHGGLLSEENAEWKGDKAGYRAIHAWVHRRITRPDHCVSCEKQDKIITDRRGINRHYLQMANISGEYKRDLKDWQYMCPSCHCKMDKGRESIQNVFRSTERANP
jgi:hypothetical protein